MGVGGGEEGQVALDGRVEVGRDGGEGEVDGGGGVYDGVAVLHSGVEGARGGDFWDYEVGVAGGEAMESFGEEVGACAGGAGGASDVVAEFQEGEA